MKVFRVLSTAFVRILLFAKCHNSALSSWHVFTVLLTSHHSRSTRLLPYFATDSCTSFVTSLRRVLLIVDSKLLCVEIKR